MDLATIKPVEKEHNVIHPGTGEPTGLVLVLACVHDSRVKAGMREANDWALKIGKDITREHEEEYESRRMSSYIVGCRFEGDAEWNGAKPKFSRELALEFASHPLIFEQLSVETRKIRDFYKA